MRVDFRLLESEQPGRAGPARRRWEQEIIGTPFERVLNEAITEIELEPAGDGTKVTLEQRQKLRGYSRIGADDAQARDGQEARRGARRARAQSAG